MVTSPARTASSVISLDGATGPGGGHARHLQLCPGRAPGRRQPPLDRDERDHLGVVARLDGLVGVGVSLRLGRRALRVAAGVDARAAGRGSASTVGATLYSSRLASGARSRRWISAVPLACRPMPMPEPGQPGSGQADEPEVDGVVDADDAAEAALLLEAGEQLVEGVVDGQPGQRAPDARPVAGETPITTSRGSSEPAAPDPTRAAARARGAPARARRSSTERCWRMASISRLPLRASGA